MLNTFEFGISVSSFAVVDFDIIPFSPLQTVVSISSVELEIFRLSLVTFQVEHTRCASSFSLIKSFGSRKKCSQ